MHPSGLAYAGPAIRLWTPPWMQAFPSNGSVHVVRCSRLSGLLMRQDIRRWPVWRCADRDQNRMGGLESAAYRHWLSRSRLVDRLPLHVLRPAHIPDDFPLASTSSGRRQCGSVWAGLKAPRIATGCPDPVSLTVCPYTSSDLPTSPTTSHWPLLFRQAPVRKRGISPSSSSAPTRCAPFGWPVRRQQPSSACAPASGATRDLRFPAGGPPTG